MHYCQDIYQLWITSHWEGGGRRKVLCWSIGVFLDSFQTGHVPFNSHCHHRSLSPPRPFLLFRVHLVRQCKTGTHDKSAFVSDLTTTFGCYCPGYIAVGQTESSKLPPPLWNIYAELPTLCKLMITQCEWLDSPTGRMSMGVYTYICGCIRWVYCQYNEIPGLSAAIIIIIIIMILIQSVYVVGYGYKPACWGRMQYACLFILIPISCPFDGRQVGHDDCAYIMLYTISDLFH